MSDNYNKVFKGPQRLQWDEKLIEAGSQMQFSGTIQAGFAYHLSGAVGATTYAFEAPSTCRGSKTIVRAESAAMTLSGSGSPFMQAVLADMFTYTAGDLLTIADGEIVTLESDGSNQYVVRGSGSLA